jgi:hypothetical protein
LIPSETYLKQVPTNEALVNNATLNWLRFRFVAQIQTPLSAPATSNELAMFVDFLNSLTIAHADKDRLLFDIRLCSLANGLLLSIQRLVNPGDRLFHPSSSSPDASASQSSLSIESLDSVCGALLKVLDQMVNMWHRYVLAIAKKFRKDSNTAIDLLSLFTGANKLVFVKETSLSNLFTVFLRRSVFLSSLFSLLQFLFLFNRILVYHLMSPLHWLLLFNRH